MTNSTGYAGSRCALRARAGRAGGALALVLACATGLGCGQDPPPDEPAAIDFDPLAPGSWWEYAHGDWTERVELSATEYEGEAAFLLAGSIDPGDGLRSDSILAERDGRIVRIAKSEYRVDAVSGSEALSSSVTYGVGFTRFNEAWPLQAVGFKESPEYDRIETPAGGTPKAPEHRKHTFELTSLSTQVVTGAGTFDCIEVKRTKDWQATAGAADASDAQTKTFWFARGVGKVQERNDETGRIEALSAYQIAQ